jgi:hypothetical protein
LGPKRDTVTGEWRKLHNEKLNGLYPLLNIVRVIKLRRMRWLVHVTHMGRGDVWWGNLREREHLDDPGIGGMIILRRIFRKWCLGAWTGSIWLRAWIGSGHL